LMIQSLKLGSMKGTLLTLCTTGLWREVKKLLCCLVLSPSN